MELSSAVVVVTGAGRGVGKAIAHAYAARGARVALASRTESQLEAVASEIRKAGGAAIAVPTDVTDPAAVERLFARTEAELGPVSILVNNAGSFQAIGPVSDVPADKWLGDIKTDLYGPFLCSQQALRQMLPRKRGYILNVIGGGVQGPLPYGSAYACSKAALMRFTETLAAELEDTGVKVFAMSPGLVRTELVEHQISSPEG
ncbi:MAG: SDR family oxidoreductase, partial [Chloroflexota bacterium]|nr:SDR family oxidoreductase [Chloroflexota bacterium]